MYKAVRNEATTVALKLLLAEGGNQDPDFLQAMELELQVTKEARHPHIVTSFGVCVRVSVTLHAVTCACAYASVLACVCVCMFGCMRMGMRALFGCVRMRACACMRLHLLSHTRVCVISNRSPCALCQLRKPKPLNN